MQRNQLWKDVSRIRVSSASIVGRLAIHRHLPSKLVQAVPSWILSLNCCSLCGRLCYLHCALALHIHMDRYALRSGSPGFAQALSTSKRSSSLRKHKAPKRTATHTTPLCHSHNKEHSKESLAASDIGREINYSTYRYDLRWLWTTTVNLVEMVMEPTHVPGLTAHKLPRICFFSTACKEAILWRCENKSNLNSSHNCCGVNDVSLSLLGGMVLIQ